MELNYFIDSWNRITIHQIVHLLNNITVCQIICKYTCVFYDGAVNKTKVTPLCHSSDNVQVLKAVIHEQQMESNADGCFAAQCFANIGLCKHFLMLQMGWKVLKTLKITIYL